MKIYLNVWFLKRTFQKTA